MTLVRSRMPAIAPARSLELSTSSPPVSRAMVSRVSLPLPRAPALWSPPARRPPMSTAWITQSARRNSSSIRSRLLTAWVLPKLSSESER